MKSEYYWQITLILVSTIATGYAGFWFGNLPDSNIVIEYRESSYNDVQNRIANTDKITITYDGEPLHKLSSVSYLVANTSQKNLDKLKLYFEVESEDNLPLFHNINTPRNYPANEVELISEKNGVYLFEIEYLNRSESIWDGISFSFYFSGNEPPKVSMKTGSKGVSIKEHTLNSSDYAEIIIRTIISGWWVILIYLVLGYIAIKFLITERQLQKSYFKKSIISEIRDIEGSEENDVVDNIIASSRTSPSFTEIVNKMFNK